MNFKQNISRNLSNIPGWRTKRKIVIIECDDWGAIRMSSKKAFDELWEQGVKPSSRDEARYLRNDGLASENDLSGLFEVLTSVKDKCGNPAVMTVVSVVANPSFDKIEQNDFNEYFYEPFTETLKRYPQHCNSFALWEEGLEKKIFVPQFHGREHLNVFNWIKALKAGEPDTLAAFKHGVYGITPANPINHVSYQAAFDISDFSEIENQKTIIKEGLELFEQIHGFKANFFVPTNGPFNNSLEEICSQSGIKYIGASKIQKEPLGDGKFKKGFHYLGQSNKHGQRYLTRNCFFEPSSDEKTDWVNACMSEIEIAFRWHKPAIISSHRVNFIGWINPSNRDIGLSQFKKLLNLIVTKWPEVEFLTSNQLGNIIVGK